MLDVNELNVGDIIRCSTETTTYTIGIFDGKYGMIVSRYYNDKVRDPWFQETHVDLAALVSQRKSEHWNWKLVSRANNVVDIQGQKFVYQHIDGYGYSLVPYIQPNPFKVILNSEPYGHMFKCDNWLCMTVNFAGKIGLIEQNGNFVYSHSPMPDHEFVEHAFNYWKDRKVEYLGKGTLILKGN